MTKALVIPPHTKINGTVQTPSDLEVQGRIDGRIEIGGALRVAAQATCRAAVRAHSARILGEVIGDLICTDSVEVTAGARVVGDIRAPEVSVDSSAEVDGRVDLLPPAPEELPLQRTPMLIRGQAPKRPTAPARRASDRS